MSDDLYSTRLRWHNGRGLAKLYGRSVVLTAAPVLAGVTVFEVDYAPEICCRQVRRAAYDATQDMDSLEIADADALLRRLVGGFSPA